MKTIWKYVIPPERGFILQVPRSFKPLHVDVQAGVPCLWAMVEPDGLLHPAYFRVVGTGHEIDFDTSGPALGGGDGYIGSFQLENGTLVFHLFRVAAS